MYWFDLRMSRNNSFIVSMIILLFTLLAMFIPHMAVELHEHMDFEAFCKQALRQSKLSWSFKKLYKKIKIYLHKILKLFQLSLMFSLVSNIRLALLNLLFFEVLILRLFFTLSPYFHNGKYKHIKSSNSSVLLG